MRTWNKKRTDMLKMWMAIAIMIASVVWQDGIAAKATEVHGTVSNNKYGVYDYAGVLSPEDVSTLEGKAKALAEYYSLDIVFLVQDDTKGKSSMVYSDDFYDGIEGPVCYGDNGIICFIDLDNDMNYIGTVGTAIKNIDDYEIELILDVAYLYDLDDYVGCLSAMADKAGWYYEYESVNDGYGTTTYKESIISQINFKICLISAAVIAVFVWLQHKNACKAVSAQHYIKDSNVNIIAGPNERFIREYTTTRAISSDSSSGRSGGGRSSGGSSHRSSSGRSHGGGGRRR